VDTGYWCENLKTCHRWEDTIKVDVEEEVQEGVVWFYLVQDRDQWSSVVNMVMNLMCSMSMHYII
jgi:hypothetical protein